MVTPEMIKPYIHNPVKFARDIIGVEPENYQAAIMMDVASKQMVSVKSGHGTGKTALASWLILWFLSTRPSPRIPCTAPTEHQLKDVLWSEIAKWLYSSSLKSEFVWTSEKVYLRTKPETWFAVARVANKSDALQGFHAKHLFFVVEEASGVKDTLFEPVLGALTEEDAKLLLIGNPTQLSGFFFNSHNKDAAKYCRHTLNAELSNRVSRQYISRIADLFGVDSDPYRVRVLGLFPKAMPDSFISMELIDRGLDFVIGDSLTPYSVNIGVDVARFGDDESVIQDVFEYNGQAYKQLKPEILHHQDTMALAGAVVNEIRSYNKQLPDLPVNVKVDETGVGAGVVDKLEEVRQKGELKFTLTPVNFGAKGGELEEEPIPFANNTGLLWGRVRHLLYKNRLDLYKDDVLISQLNNRKYRLTGDGEIVLERKEDMKKRGASSPDRADALVIALAPVEGSGVAVIDFLF
jgi:phage terminase large subunit